MGKGQGREVKDKQIIRKPKTARTQPGTVCRSCGEIWSVRWPRGTGRVS